MGHVVRLALFAGIVCAASSLTARAGDPAPPPDLVASLTRAHALVEQEQWSAGESALRKVFTDFAEDPGVRSRLRRIEDDLKVCLFRKAQPPLKGQDLFGSAARRLNPATQDVELQYSSFDAAPWQTTSSGGHVLNLRFAGPITLEADVDYLSRDNTTITVFLCWDVEKRGGYVVSPGYWAQTATSTLSAPSKAVRIDRTRDVDLKNQANVLHADFNGPLTVSRTGADIVAKVGAATVVRASDPNYTSGLVGFHAGRMRCLTIKGRIDRHAWRKMVAERYAKQFADWAQKSYDREKEIPSWAREAAVAAPDVTFTELPSDADRRTRSELAAAVEAAVQGDMESAVESAAAAEVAPPRTALYLRGAAGLALGSFKDAQDSLAKLVEAEPEFVPGRLLRGMALYGLRRFDEASLDLAWALERRPRAAAACVVAAEIAMFEHDFVRADTLLAKADEAGAAGIDLDQIRDYVHRAEAGPNLAQRFEQATDHFVVASDHSAKLCYEVGKLLESMQPQYAAALPGAPARFPKARVYVFSGRQGYRDYTQDLDCLVESSAGVYMPQLRELAVWIPDDMTDFADTVRHEGFHQYLNRLVDHAPIWYNEGYAECMGGGGPEGLRDARRDGELVKQFVPVRTLVAMRQPAFMAVADVAYTESRYLVDYLRGTKHPKLKGVLSDYYAALREGLSQDQANARVLAPVMDVLEAEFTRSL